jgi:tRNA threonylcarbamoyladenosine biosynthesis protein TsaE
VSLRTFSSRSEEETLAIGEHLASLLPLKAAVLLTGELGAGKTTLAKGIVKGLGAAPAEKVSSPTFTLIHEYGDPVRVYHIDLYRLDHPRELATLGLEEIFEREAVVIIEWGDKFPGFMPARHYRVHLEASNEERLINVTTSQGLRP